MAYVFDTSSGDSGRSSGLNFSTKTKHSGWGKNAFSASSSLLSSCLANTMAESEKTSMAAVVASTNVRDLKETKASADSFNGFHAKGSCSRACLAQSGMLARALGMGLGLLAVGISSCSSRKEKLAYPTADDSYEGSVMKNAEGVSVPHKNGRCEYHAGSDKGAVYDGEWLIGKREGRGTLTFADGGFYRGNWKGDKPEGFGTLKYSNGDIFEGTFKEGKAEGKGTYLWCDGEKHAGEFSGGAPSGECTRTAMDGGAPKAFLCAQCGAVMRDPIDMPDGFTYERMTIIQYLQGNTHSRKRPSVAMTVEQATNARTNVKLQRQIQAWQAGNLVAQPQPFVPGAQAQITMKLSAVSGVVKGQSYIHASCVPDADTPRPPVTLVPIIDISGSMSENCLDGMQALIGIEYTRLQMVQYSLRLIIKTLDANDFMAIVTFSSGSQEALPRTQMDAAGKARATQVVDGLRAGGCTDIWGAVQRAINIADGLAGQQTNTVLMLFTDGQPTSSPPEGEVEALRRRLADPHRFTMSTFGYGKEVPSERMMQMAQLANGIYGYCPLPGMVMSIFLNFVAQAATCITQRAEFEFRCDGGRTVKEVRNLYQGQALNFLLPGRSGDFSGFVTFDGQRHNFPACRDADAAPDNEGLSTQFFRQALIKLLKECIANPGDAQARIAELWDALKEHRPTTPFIRKLAVDLVDEDNPDGEDLDAQPSKGKIHKAFVAEKFRKWGKDEIRALITFHEAEVCGVLLDQALQEYQSGPFAVRRRYGWREFCDMPRIKGESKIFDKIPDNNPSMIKSKDGRSIEIDQQMIAGLAGSFIQG